MQTRNETLEKLQFSKQASVSPVFKFSAGNVDEVKKAITTLDGTINKIEDHRSTAEKDIATFVSTLHAAVDARGAVLVSEMQTKGDQLRKTAIQEKGEIESATVQFREFHSFTEGLLSQGTPLEIAGTHKMVKT